MWGWRFVLNSLLLGVGLTMDAFSVSIADGLEHPNLRKIQMVGIAGLFAFFQFAMPMIGWVCVHTIAKKLDAFRYFIPWIALLLLVYIGGKMVYENVKKNKNPEQEKFVTGLTFKILLLQGIATSIDALSVGFTIAYYTWEFALIACMMIACVTFGFCIIGLLLGKKFGARFSKWAELVGGLILIAIGIEIWLSNILELYG